MEQSDWLLMVGSDWLIKVRSDWLIMVRSDWLIVLLTLGWALCYDDVDLVCGFEGSANDSCSETNNMWPVEQAGTGEILQDAEGNAGSV